MFEDFSATYSSDECFYADSLFKFMLSTDVYVLELFLFKLFLKISRLIFF
jgi:hypothetical protein